MHFRALGMLEVELDDGRVVPISGEKRQQLLALLLFSPNTVLSTEYLIHQVWGERPPPAARNSLHQQVRALRELIGDRLETAGSGYALRVTSDELDLARFADLTVEAERRLATDPTQALEKLHEALDLWRGPVVEGLDRNDRIREEADRLDELRLTAVENLWEASLAVGEDQGAIAELQRLTELHPFRERFWGLLMTALYRGGRQTEALRTFQNLRRLLGEELGVEPSRRLKDLEERILLQDQALLHVSGDPAPMHGVPQPFTSFVSRQDELDTVKKMLGGARLVTLTGPPGVGKSRLAIEITERLSGRFRDGIFWVDLAPLTESKDLLDHVAAELGSGTTTRSASRETIELSLASSQILIVLDNCEHLIVEVATMTQELLSSGSQVVVLATSRVVLGIPGEHVWLVRPLEIPSDHSPDLSQPVESEAVRLFVDRAQASDPDFMLDSDTTPSVAAICEAVEGLPLALELIASQVSYLPVAELARMISVDSSQAGDQPFGPLARHGSLGEAIRRSFSLLADSQERFLHQLSAFESDFEAQGVEAVLGATDRSTNRILGDLARASLLVRTSADEADGLYYRLMQPLRDLARDELDNHELERLQRRHDAHYAGLARRASGVMRTESFFNWLDRLRLEYADFLVSLERSHMQDRREDSLYLAAALSHLWVKDGRGKEGRPWLIELLDEANGGLPGPVAEIATALGVIEGYQGNFDAAAKHFQVAISFWREDDPRGLVDALAEYGRLAVYMNDHALAREMVGEALEISDSVGYAWGRAWPLAFKAQSLLFEGSFEPEVKAMFLEAADLHRSRGDDAGLGHVYSFLTAMAIAEDDAVGAQRAADACAEHYRLAHERTEFPYFLFIQGIASYAAGDHERAVVMGREALTRANAQGNLVHIGLALQLLAATGAALGDSETGARLMGAARRHQPMVVPFEGPLYLDHAVARLRDALGEEAFDQLIAEGGRMSVPEVVDFALAR